MMFPYWKYALKVFAVVFAITLVLLAAFALFGGKGLVLLVLIFGLLLMFYIMATEGPR